MAAKKKPFEESMTRLEEIVSILERGESTLDESLALFEEGTKQPVPNNWIRQNRKS